VLEEAGWEAAIVLPIRNNREPFVPLLRERKRMELTGRLDSAKRIFTVRVTGEYRRPADGYEAQRFVIDSFADHGCRRILLDLTQAVIVSGTLSTYQTAADPEPEVAHELRKFQFAAVYREIGKDEQFFETVARNRGLVVRAFDSLEPAIEWLERFPETDSSS
jgi:hypothetical protein